MIPGYDQWIWSRIDSDMACLTFRIHLVYIKSIRNSHHMENATSYHTDLPPRPASGPEYNCHHKADKDQLPYIHIPSSRGDIPCQEYCPSPAPNNPSNTLPT